MLMPSKNILTVPMIGYVNSVVSSTIYYESSHLLYFHTNYKDGKFSKKTKRINLVYFPNHILFRCLSFIFAKKYSGQVITFSNLRPSPCETVSPAFFFTEILFFFKHLFIYLGCVRS